MTTKKGKAKPTSESVVRIKRVPYPGGKEVWCCIWCGMPGCKGDCDEAGG